MLSRALPALIYLGLVVLTGVLLVVFLVPGITDDEVVSPIVETSVGVIQGRREPNGKYDVFLGIPYARVNETNNFGVSDGKILTMKERNRLLASMHKTVMETASRPYPRFKGVFLADDDSARCPQMDNNNPVGSTDCLQLNIFVPRSASIINLVPVMLWINGHEFESNWKSSAHFGPKYLVRHDVIYVSINYRVGPYGFMCLDIPEVPGNQGLKDQSLALRWIRDNIEAFGGDVSRITVFGSSAGAQSIDFHILSDNEPIFNNAILQSGSAVSPTVFNEHVKTAPIAIAAHLGFKTNSVYEALSHLSSLHSNLVVQAWKELDLNFKPCAEMQFHNVEPFLTRNWVSTDELNARGMSILTGYNEQEQLLQYTNPNAVDENKLIHDKLQESFDFDDDEQKRMEQNVKHFYFGDVEVASDILQAAINFDSDYTYAYPVHRSIENYLRSEAENVFLYVFSYNGRRNAGKSKSGVSVGPAAHGDEIGYIFDMELFEDEPTAEDQRTIDVMTKMWTNFAKYSNPTPTTSNLLPVSWSPISDDSFNYLSINSDLSVSRRPIHTRMTFWELFYKYNEEHQKGFEANY